MANKLYEETSIQAIANAIRSKNGSNTTYKLADMADAVLEIQTGIEPIEHSWNQIPTLVKNYLDNVTYNPSDYTVSSIADYAPSTADVNNTYPIGVTLETSSGILDREGYEISVSDGNTTIYNDIPNKYTEYVVRNNGTVSQVGTLRPTGFLRQIKCATTNVRDLGGWSCDGGTVKYGKLFRGGEIAEADIELFVNQLGIRHELNLRGLSESHERDEEWWDKSILGDFVGYTCPENYVWHSITDKTTWKEIFRCIFDCVAENKPLFFHCAAGADRTGTVACMIEAILGMSQSDIDKDYELTCFMSGTSSDTQARRRNESDWQGQINAINALIVGSSFRDKAINWLASMGFTADEINAFRKAMIDGTPDTITLSTASYTVTNTLSNVTTDNESTSVAQYQPYEANIKAANGYAIDSIKITMGGTDITSSVFTGAKTNLNRAVTLNLTNCTMDNMNKAVVDGQAYAATITPDTGYTLDGATVSITMGGVDISECYSNGVIAIPSATGDIVVTATMAELPKETLPITWLNGKTCTYSVGSACTVSTSSSYVISEEIPVEYGKTYIYTLKEAGSDSQLKFVGIDDSGVVTEAKNFGLSTVGDFEWTPTVATTTKLRLRSYATQYAVLSQTTELIVE